MELYSKNVTSIFRPWDNSTRSKPKIFNSAEEPASYQDCTISTTTDNDLNENSTPTVKSSSENVDRSKENQTQPRTNIQQTKKTNTKRKAREISEKKQKRLNTSQNKTTTQNTPVLQAQSEISNQPYNELYFNVPLIDTTHSQQMYPNSNLLYDYPPASLMLPGVDTNVPTTPTAIDPVVMESLALHGYAAMEEYVRIMNHEQQTKLLNNRKQRPKKYKCPHCNVRFSNNGQLKGHIRIHTGERPFRCDEKNCGKTFTRNEELTRHKRIHSGLRPFPCNACGKRFGRKDHLKKHTKTHITASQRNGLQLVPVVLPAGAWASIPPTSGIPMYNPTTVTPFPPSTHPHGASPIFPYSALPTASATTLYGF